MKITIVQGPFLPVPPKLGGAIEKAWFALGKEFARCGHEVTHISRAYPGLAKDEVIEGVRHLRISGFRMPGSMAWLKFLDLVYAWRVRGILPGADILVTHTFWLPMLVRSHKKGLVYVHVGRYPKGQMRFYRRAAALQTVSTPIARAICQQEPSAASRVRVIPYPLSESSEGFQEGERQKVILYTGRIHPEKGLELLLRAFALLAPKELRDWKLQLVGPWETEQGGGGGPFLDELKILAEPFAGQIDWVGPVFDAEKLNQYYRTASLFVYPSLAETGETFGLAPLEAMSWGCPPLVSALECFSDFVEDGKNGFMFQSRSENAVKILAQTLAELAADPVRLENAGRQARITAGEYALKEVAERYLTDFEKIVMENKTR